MVLEMAEKTKNQPLYVPDVATITETEALTPTEKKFVIQFDNKEKETALRLPPDSFWRLQCLESAKLLFQFLHRQIRKALLNYASGISGAFREQCINCRKVPK
jgi:lipid-A-disaccharide synthase-like uncharacterized protein